jgi:hypothetical protein
MGRVYKARDTRLDRTPRGDRGPRRDLAMGDGFLLVERDPLSMLTEFRVVQNWPSQWKP